MLDHGLQVQNSQSTKLPNSERSQNFWQVHSSYWVEIRIAAPCAHDFERKQRVPGVRQGATMRIVHGILVLAIWSSATLALTAVPAAWGAEAEKPNPGKPSVTSLPKLPAELHNALQGRDFADAVKLIDGLAADKHRTDVDYLLYLKGLALINLGQLDAALENFARLEQDYPQ